MLSVALKVPLPIFVSDTGPVAVKLLPLKDAAAFETVMVVLIVVDAWAASDKTTQAMNKRIEFPLLV